MSSRCGGWPRRWAPRAATLTRAPRRTWWQRMRAPKRCGCGGAVGEGVAGTVENGGIVKGGLG
eukprot:305391-Chlamydomonas_euryale.AAC.1